MNPIAASVVSLIRTQRRGSHVFVMRMAASNGFHRGD